MFCDSLSKFCSLNQLVGFIVVERMSCALSSLIKTLQNNKYNLCNQNYIVVALMVVWLNEVHFIKHIFGKLFIITFPHQKDRAD